MCSQNINFDISFLSSFVTELKHLVQNQDGTSTTGEDVRKTSPTSETGNGMRRLQDEINTLTKKNYGKQCGMK
jgi:hypothetical protein